MITNNKPNNPPIVKPTAKDSNSTPWEHGLLSLHIFFKQH